MNERLQSEKKISEKRVGIGRVVQPNGTSWDKLDYVGQVGQGEGGLQIFVGQVGQGQGVCPLEPFHLSQMGLQGRATFRTFSISVLFWVFWLTFGCSVISGHLN